jgi:hypothetical protein
MFSVLNPTHIYRDLSPDVLEHDEDIDAEEWVYSDKTVYRGTPDPKYTELNVYSLYDENITRIGIAEHNRDDPSVFQALWFHDNPFATLLQEPGWKQTGKTLWSILSPEAYHDLLDSDFKDVLLKCSERVVKPSYISDGFPVVYKCEECGLFSLKAECHTMKKVIRDSFLFIDDSYILYEPPSDSKVWSMLEQQHVVVDHLTQQVEQTLQLE